MSCWTVPVERVPLPLERVVLLLPLERTLPSPRLTLLPEDRVDPLPLERTVPSPRFTVLPEEPEERVAELPVLRLRLSCWTEPEERVLPEEEPEERVAELLPVLRLRLSCWTAPEDRVLPEEDPEERDTLLPEEEPEERVAEPEELREEEDEVLWEERVLLPLLPRERLWASISGAVSMAMAITRDAANVINLFIASEF